MDHDLRTADPVRTRSAERGGIAVFMADDHPVVREGLRAILEGEAGIRIVGEAATGDETLERIGAAGADVLLLDVTMPGPGFLETMRRLRPTGVKVLVVTMHPEERFGVKAIEAGAAGYLTKVETPGSLVEAVRRVHAGGTWIGETLAARLAAASRDAVEPHEELSEREFQVLRLLGAGMTIGAIADRLSLSPKTVSTYRTRILKKLDLATTPEIVRYAVENDLAP